MLLMIFREPLVYLQQYSPFIVSPVLDQTYLHLLFMCSTAHASYIQIAGLEMNYLEIMIYTLCLTGLLMVLLVPAGGSITSRYILLWHQIIGGLWRI